MAEKKSSNPVHILTWEGKGGSSGVTPMHDRNAETGEVIPWSPERLAKELAGHEKLGNKVFPGIIHQGKIIGGAPSYGDTIERRKRDHGNTRPYPSAAKPAAKPTDKPADKPARKPAGKPADKPASKTAAPSKKAKK